MSLESYIEGLEEKTAKHNIKLILKNQKYFLDGGISIGGYFGDELAVATNKPEEVWLSYLIHEDSHLDQWIEKCIEYRRTRLREGICATSLMHSWIKGKCCSPRMIERAITAVRGMELDCERRALKKIKKFNLPVDPSHYIKTAAINIHQYNYILLRRRYLRKGGKLPYEEPKIISQMPRTLRGKFTRLTNAQLEAFDKFME